MPQQSQQPQSPLDEPGIRQYVEDLITEGFTNNGVVAALALHKNISTTDDSIRRFRRRHGLGVPSASTRAAQTSVKGDQAEVRTEAKQGQVKLDDPDAMLKERGLDPAEWHIEGATVNEWDGPSQEGPVTYHQAKLHLKRKVDSQIFAARTDGWIAPVPVPRVSDEPRLIVITGDQQCPFHDRRLHELFNGWLDFNQPDEMISLGDKLDFPDISRHRWDPENNAKVNECIQSGYDVFRAYRDSAPNMRMRFMPGNHDERIRNILLDKPSVQPLYGVKQADAPEGDGPSVLALPHLLRLDELQIEYEDPKGPYDLAQINVCKHLAVRHGWIARKGSGTSALDTLDHLGYSVIVGHTHRQSIVYKTTHDIDGGSTTLTAAEAGCMCRIDQQVRDGRKFPDFSVLPDWQQGFTTVTVHTDGFFRIENATYVNGTLLWRDQEYR